MRKMVGTNIARGRYHGPRQGEKVGLCAVGPKGAEVAEGDIIGTVETPIVVHKIMVPPGLSRIITEIYGEFTILQPVARIKSAAAK